MRKGPLAGAALLTLIAACAGPNALRRGAEEVVACTRACAAQAMSLPQEQQLQAMKACVEQECKGGGKSAQEEPPPVPKLEEPDVSEEEPEILETVSPAQSEDSGVPAEDIVQPSEANADEPLSDEQWKDLERQVSELIGAGRFNEARDIEDSHLHGSRFFDIWRKASQSFEEKEEYDNAAEAAGYEMDYEREQEMWNLYHFSETSRDYKKVEDILRYYSQAKEGEFNAGDSSLFWSDEKWDQEKQRREREEEMLDQISSIVWYKASQFYEDREDFDKAARTAFFAGDHERAREMWLELSEQHEDKEEFEEAADAAGKAAAHERQQKMRQKASEFYESKGEFKKAIELSKLSGDSERAKELKQRHEEFLDEQTFQRELSKICGSAKEFDWAAMNNGRENFAERIKSLRQDVEQHEKEGQLEDAASFARDVAYYEREQRLWRAVSKFYEDKGWLSHAARASSIAGDKERREALLLELSEQFEEEGRLKDAIEVFAWGDSDLARERRRELWLKLSEQHEDKEEFEKAAEAAESAGDYEREVEMWLKSFEQYQNNGNTEKAALAKKRAEIAARHQK